MPAQTVEQLEKKRTDLTQKLADAGDKLEGPARRTLKKKIKRAERKHRRLSVAAARSAKAEAKSEAKTEAPAEKETEEQAATDKDE